MNDLFGDKKGADQELVVDETMVPFRGRLLFRQYIPGKAHKYGIKIFKVCDKSGYRYSIKVYMGKGTNVLPNMSMASSVVLELMNKHLGKGHTLYTDNFYTSLELANSLLSNETHLVGTIRKNRKGLPNDVVKQKLSKGEMICLENGEGVVITKWQDKREVHMLSTLHGPQFVETGKKGNTATRLKPLVIHDYNNAKVGIDLSDQMSSYSTAVRKTMRWYHKVGEEILLGTAVVNSWLAYNSFFKSRTTPTNVQKKGMSITLFKESIAASLMGLQDEPIPAVKKTGHHYLSSTPIYVGQGKNRRRARKVCKMCYKKVSMEQGRAKARNMTQVLTFCNECPEKPFLCEQCFKELHK